MSEPCQHELKRCRHCSREYCVKCGLVPEPKGGGMQHTHRVVGPGAVKHAS